MRVERLQNYIKMRDTMKSKLFHEKIHKATNFEPYLDPYMINLNYLSHFHEEVEAIYINEGSVIIGLDKQIYQLNKGDIAIIMPCDVHYYTSTSFNRAYIIKFQPIQEKDTVDFTQISLNTPIITKEHVAFNKIKAIILDIFQENDQRNIYYRTSINAKIFELAVTLMRELDFKTVSLDEKKKNKERLIVLQKVIDYVEENFQKNITLTDVAKATGFSVYYFAHYFKKAMGVGFWEYLSSFRTEKVKQMLAVSDQKIIDIALSCGFNSLKTFNRVFKKYSGCSPLNYKKQYLTKAQQ